jgi:hypothetical protein
MSSYPKLITIDLRIYDYIRINQINFIKSQMLLNPINNIINLVWLRRTGLGYPLVQLNGN